MPIKPDMIGIAVKHMASSLRFYRLLGLDIPAERDTEDHVEVTVNGYRLAWDTVDLLKLVYGEWAENPVGHRLELAFRCDSPAEVEATYRRIVEGGHDSHKEPWDAFWGQRYAVVVDPDGNLISLFAPLG